MRRRDFLILAPCALVAGVASPFALAAAQSFQGKQIRMDVLLHLMPPAMRRAFDVFADLLGIVVSVFLIVIGWPVIM